MNQINRWIRVGLAAWVLMLGVAHAQTPLGSVITYQGELRQGGTPATGAADLRFRLFDADIAGAQVGSQISIDGVSLSSGRFTASIDFGAAAFGGDARWLEVDARHPAGTGSFVTLSPRQRVTPAPAARYAAEAGNAVNATQFNGQTASFYQNAANLSGTLPSSLLSGSYSGAVAFNNGANTFTGTGSGLIGLNASNIASGTIPDARLSANVALLGGTQTFTGAKTFSGGLSTNAFTLGAGAAAGRVLTSNASGIGTWQVPTIPLPYAATAGNSSGAILDVTNSNTSSGYGLHGHSASTIAGSGVGVWGSSDGAYGVYGSTTHATNVTSGVWGQSASVNGRGVTGYSTALSGNTSFGVLGQSDSTGGAGVYGYVPFGTGSSGVLGQSDGGNGVGVKGVANNGASASGVWGESSSGYGIFGISTAQFGRGIVGQANNGSAAAGVYGESSSGTGVRGDSTAPGGKGVYGQASGAGVSGFAIGTSAYGVQGMAISGTNNAGVYGTSSALNGNGIIGEALNGSSAYAIWARASQGTGVFCQGALAVSGSKAFRIDHPSDPENKYLLHYCSEGPEPLNIYRGNTTTSESGFATITLPPYFAQVNRDPSFQLTVIDNSEDFVLVKVVEGVRDNAFTIRTSKPGIQVSWEVKGIRNDLYTRHYGAPVEQDKTDKDRGTYQHPELYAMPKERMLGFTPSTLMSPSQSKE